MAIKKHDFVEIEYTGMIKEDDIIFDTTDEKSARENNIFNEDMAYGPVTICIGEGQLLKGIENSIIGKEAGKEYKFELKPEDGFGNKDGKLIQLIPTSKFRQQSIQPMPGLQVNIDGILGTIKTVSGGRTLVDFNHPLSGKELVYNIKINKIIENDKEKLNAYLGNIGIKPIDILIENGNANVKVKKELNKKLKDEISGKLKDIIPAIKSIEFVIDKEEKNK